MDPVPKGYMYTAGVGPMPVCGVSGGIKVKVEGKIVEATTKAGVGDTEKVLTEASSDEVGDADDNANDSGALSIGRVGDGTKLVVDGGIVKVFTRTGVGDAKEILIRALPGRLEDADDMAADWGPEG